jgi:hypothetical protein
MKKENIFLWCSVAVIGAMIGASVEGWHMSNVASLKTSASLLETRWESMSTNGVHVFQVGIVTSNHCDFVPHSDWPPIRMSKTLLPPLSRVLERSKDSYVTYSQNQTIGGKQCHVDTVFTPVFVVGTGEIVSYELSYTTNEGSSQAVVSGNVIIFTNR